jgi:hypothetical protein
MKANDMHPDDRWTLVTSAAWEEFCLMTMTSDLEVRDGKVYLFPPSAGRWAAAI